MTGHGTRRDVSNDVWSVSVNHTSVGPTDPRINASCSFLSIGPCHGPADRWKHHIARIHRAGVPAVPPLLQITAELLRKQGQHRRGGSRSGLQQLDGIGRASAGSQIRNKTTSDPSPAGLLAAPDQSATWPRQLLAIKQTAAGSQDPEAVLASWAGVDTAGNEQSIDNGTTHHWRDAMGSLEQDSTTKNHPEGWFRTATNAFESKLSRALPRHGS